MQRLLFLFLGCITVIMASAQKLDISILSFELDPFATTAQADSRYAERDKGGELYAIIKVKDNDGDDVPDGFSFDFGAVKTLKQELHDGELWVWVQRNAKTVTIRHPEYRTIEKFDLGQTIQPGQTYNMRVTMSRVVKVAQPSVRKQVLQFEVTPASEHALVRVKGAADDDYELWGEVDIVGKIDRSLDFGTYDYIVTATNYDPSYGRVTLDNNSANHIESIHPNPNFGYLEVTDDYGCNGAEIYINDSRVGTIPYKSDRMECREDYSIAVINGDLYKSYSSTFAIRKGETTCIAPQLQINYAQTTLRVEGNAEIYVDGVLKGSGQWCGPLKAGQYNVTCRKLNHHTSNKVINVRVNVEETFDLPTPLPITGALYVRSIPSDATVIIDGQIYGVTPMSINDMLIGEHQVQLQLNGYKNENRTITLSEGEYSSIEISLTDMKAHDAVDLGLSVNWATCNVGADNPEDPGNCYAWGEVIPKRKIYKKQSRNWHKYKWGKKSNLQKYCSQDKLSTLELNDDAANVCWEDAWRMPTKQEMEELLNSCEWKWTTLNGSYGYNIKSRINGNSIFLPAAGYYDTGAHDFTTSRGSYWTNSLMPYFPYYATSLYFDSSRTFWRNNYRCVVSCIRPVRSAGRPIIEHGSKVYDVIEQPPTFPGGEAALLKYIATHIMYPQIAQEQEIQGVVNLRFIINPHCRLG